MVNTVIFDFDGVIADSVGSIFKWFQHAASVFRINLSIKSIEQLKQNFFEPYPEFYKFLGFDWDNDLEKIFQEYIQYHSTHPPELVDGIQQVIETLSDLSHIKLAIVSSNVQSVLEEGLKHHQLYDHFDVIKGVEKENNTPLKPDPTTLLEVLDSLESSFSEAVYIGDQPSDVLTAVNASKSRTNGKIHTISVTTGFASRQKLEDASPRADFVIDHPSEILEKLQFARN
ncbi:HAD family hydrolase [bacterium]|nr:HAD family hydrolase [bacterium]